MAKEPLLSDLFTALPTDTQEKVMRAALGAHLDTNRFSADPADVEKGLALKYGLFMKKHAFHRGQFVKWKAGLKNRKRPEYGEPAVVVDVLREPVHEEGERSASTPYFREPLDIALGILDEDADFLVYHFDSRRFEPIRPQKKAK